MNLWESLFDTLEEQNKIYLQLNDLMEAKQNFIFKNDLVGLEETVAQGGALAKHLSLLETKRMEVVEQLVQELPLSGEEVTLNQLEEYLPQKYESYYRELRNQLEESLVKVALLNKTNQDLLEASLAYVNYSLSLMAGMQSGNSYGQQGQEQDSRSSKRSLFDQKV